MSSKILVALSGGVDSAVAALLLQQEGYDIAGAYMRTWMDEGKSNIFADCPWEEDIQSAKAVAAHLNIDFEVINFIDAYRERVVAYMVEGYRKGITPNPDIMCNREMKFGVFREYARDNGFDGLATGHYCRIETLANGTRCIREGKDKNKDQSYFLAMVPQQQLHHVHFPIGTWKKPAVRDIAVRNNLPNARRKDSQGICFLGKVNVQKFLSQYIADSPGQIVRLHDGKVLGQHQGLHNFTPGQRRGIGVPSNTDGKNYVVISKDYTSNQLTVAFDEIGTPGLYQDDVIVHHLNWIMMPRDQDSQLCAKPRYRDPGQEITIQDIGNQLFRVKFLTPQRALAAGQVVALYHNDCLLGGGFYR